MNGLWRLYQPAVPPGRCGTCAPRSSACCASGCPPSPRAGTARSPTRSPHWRSPPRSRSRWRPRRCSTSPLSCGAATGSRCSPSTPPGGTPVKASSTPKPASSTQPGPRPRRPFPGPSAGAALDGPEAAEAAATLRLRAGDAGDWYARAGRVRGGQVEADGLRLRDGNLAGTGDWVKNGDAWHVERRHADGSLTVRNTRHGGRVRLPADYVQAQVQLLYATTAHRAQGGTADTAHPLITASLTREMLYVLATRARERTTFYVATHDLPFDEDARVNQVRSDPDAYAAREALLSILGGSQTLAPASAAPALGFSSRSSLENRRGCRVRNGPQRARAATED